MHIRPHLRPCGPKLPLGDFNGDPDCLSMVATAAAVGWIDAGGHAGGTCQAPNSGVWRRRDLALINPMASEALLEFKLHVGCLIPVHKVFTLRLCFSKASIACTQLRQTPTFSSIIAKAVACAQRTERPHPCVLTRRAMQDRVAGAIDLAFAEVALPFREALAMGDSDTAWHFWATCTVLVFRGAISEIRAKLRGRDLTHSSSGLLQTPVGKATHTTAPLSCDFSISRRAPPSPPPGA